MWFSMRLHSEKSGTVFPIEVSMRYLEHDGKGMCHRARRVRAKACRKCYSGGSEALRRSQEALRALHSQLLTAQEDERRRVARSCMMIWDRAWEV